MEYGFGAHDFPISGVFEVEPKTCPGFVFRCSVPLGRINMPVSEFRSFIESVASEYHGDTYHLISKNCNHFTDDIARRLTGKGIPGWVNRLAHLGTYTSSIYQFCLAFNHPLDVINCIDQAGVCPIYSFLLETGGRCSILFYVVLLHCKNAMVLLL